MWKDVPNYEGYYQVSDDGHVRSLPRRVKASKGTALKQGKDLACVLSNAGYPVVVLAKEGICTKIEVHRLMALAFFGEPNGCLVHHKNGIRHDNRLDNLEYKQTQEHSSYHSKGTSNPRAKLTEDDVRDVRRQLAQGERQIDIAARFGVTQAQVSAIKFGKTWAHIT